MLDCTEHARVHVGLESPEGIHHLPVADDRAGTPPCHVVALGEREELDTHVLGTRSLEEAGRHVAVEGDVGVGVVVHHHQVVRFGEVHQPGEEVVLDNGSRGVVGIADEEHLGLGEH